MNTFCLSLSHHWVLECSKQRIFLSVETVHFPNFEELLNFSQIACLWTFLCLLISMRTSRYFQNNI